MNINRELSYRELFQHEHELRHTPYEKELGFYAAVKAGDLDLVNKLYTPLTADGYGKLSRDSLRNMQYHLVISVAMITRFCIEGGMQPETAYTISDIYINKLDECTDTSQLTVLHREMITDYTERMKQIQSGEAYSKNVLMCINLIYDNIYNGVRVQDLAAKLGLTPQYLSRLFRQETGTTVSDFIMARRIQAAENMLKYSELSSIDIGNYLSFSSHSHFIASFKRLTGMTPKQYRERNFRLNWNSASAR